MPQLLLLDGLRGVPRVRRHHLLHRHAKGEELAHEIHHVLQPRVHAVRVQIGRDRVRQESCLRQRDRHTPEKAAGAVADVEENALFAAFHERLAGTERGGILFAAAAAIHVRPDVPGPEDSREQLAGRSHPGAAEIHHHRDVFDRPHFDGTLERRPLRPFIVRALDADDESLVRDAAFH